MKSRIRNTYLTILTEKHWWFNVRWIVYNALFIQNKLRSMDVSWMIYSLYSLTCVQSMNIDPSMHTITYNMQKWKAMNVGKRQHVRLFIFVVQHSSILCGISEWMICYTSVNWYIHARNANCINQIFCNLIPVGSSRRKINRNNDK